MNRGIIIKGNKDGIIVEIDLNKFDNFDKMLDSLLEKLSKGKQFYKNSSIYISTNLSDLSKSDIEKLNDKLINEICVSEIIFEDINNKKDEKSESNRIFDGISEGRTKFFRKTIRGGQSINFHGNIVIIGDVNSGSEVHAAGNIIVIGAIKGNIFAGEGGNSNAIIAAFSLQPEILKIGDIITISPDSDKPQYPEVAYVNDNEIIVEPYLNNKYLFDLGGIN